MKWIWNKIVALKNIVLWTFTKRLFRVVRKFYAQLTHPKCLRDRYQMAKSIPSDDSLGGILKGLKTTGFAWGNGFLENHLLKELEAASVLRAASFDPAEIKTTSVKDFWKSVLKPEDQTTNSVFVKIALHPKILAVVTQYLGQVPYLAEISLVVSEGINDGQWKASQLWHRDHNDKNMCKLFIYLTDVDVDTGPFTLIPADQVEKLKGERYFPIHKKDEEMSRIGGLSHATPMLGKKLSSFFVDTYRCYHMGSRTRRGEKRIMYIATYTTFAPYTPFFNRVAVQRPLTALETLVLQRFGERRDATRTYDEKIPEYN